MNPPPAWGPQVLPSSAAKDNRLSMVAEVGAALAGMKAASTAVMGSMALTMVKIGVCIM